MQEIVNALVEVFFEAIVKAVVEAMGHAIVGAIKDILVMVWTMAEGIVLPMV